jgi:hypothetical protein
MLSYFTTIQVDVNGGIMSTEHDYDMSPEMAAFEIERTPRRVKRRAQWPSWLLLAVAAVDFCFL